MASIYLMHNERFDYLVSKKFGDQLTQTEEAELDLLLKNEAELRFQYNLLQQYWADKQSPNRRDQELFQQILTRIDRPVAQIHEPALSPKFPRVLIAAAAVVLLMLGGWWFLMPEVEQHKFVADRKQQKVVLDDGTEVVLNYKSVLYYPSNFDADGREVTVSGEAFFRVAKDTDRPFIVHTKHADLHVLGTTFNVRAYPDEETTEASLIEGALQVTAVGKNVKPILLEPSEKLILPNTYEMAPKQRQHTKNALSSAARKVRIQFLKPTDAQAVETTWIDDKLVFKNVSFADLAKTLSRKYDVQIHFQRKRLANLRFTASFDQEDLADILRALQVATPFQYRTEDKRIIIFDELN